VVCKRAGYGSTAVWPHDFKNYNYLYVDGYALMGFVVEYDGKNPSKSGFFDSLPVDITNGELFWMTGYVRYDVLSVAFTLESIEPYQ
jgi:hypothetical protein